MSLLRSVFCPHRGIGRIGLCLLLLTSVAGALVALAEDESVDQTPTLEQLKRMGAMEASLRERVVQRPSDTPAEPDLATFQSDISPLLTDSCVQCHGESTHEGNLRIDTLDPDLFHGQDVDWWVEVLAVLTNGEMPPPDDGELAAADRARIVEWLAKELQVASAARRAQKKATSFRRMTRYEYRYAMQDLLGMPLDFGKHLPPDSMSDDGFSNSSETLHLSSMQFGIYRESALNALRLATVRGPQPAPLYWSVDMDVAAAGQWKEQDGEREKLRQQFADEPNQLKAKLEQLDKRFRQTPRNTHYFDLETGRAAAVTWRYPGARYAWSPLEQPPDPPAESNCVAVIPHGRHLIVELGDRIPDKGIIRVRVLASRRSPDGPDPSLQLEFGWQASNDSAASVRISQQDLTIDAPPGEPRYYQWEVPLSEIYPRNSVRGISEMGDLPSPSEFVKLVNRSVQRADVQISHVDVAAPVYATWPPRSHRRIFGEAPSPENREQELASARRILGQFLPRAWRRPISTVELDKKLALFSRVRPSCDDFSDAITEVLATVLASPQFLYLDTPAPVDLIGDSNSDASGGENPESQRKQLSDYELATRLSMFLWCSIPDDQLLELAAQGRLGDPTILGRQVERMLSDPRSQRFSTQFVRHWLGLELLDYLDVDRKAYPDFDAALKDAMRLEPIMFFDEILKHNRSVLDFIHADYVVVNDRLAQHYDLPNVYGNEFRRVDLSRSHHRGGLLSTAGLLAMNSDGKDSHPLKRGIWLLEHLLNDPPPPPPPAVPEIDLADPEIAKLTLKERIEDHRNDAACMSCHAKIDPWGIAFENYDAVGRWRTEAAGRPVDATSQLFNGQKLDGIIGLKRYLLSSRQDQFARAMVYKTTTFALGRPLSFGDRAGIDEITHELRRRGDGLATMVTLIVTSELFQNR